MAVIIEAIYENGVFVPVQPPDLAEHHRVRLVIEPVQEARPDKTEIVRDRMRRKLRPDPELAAQIARDPEFLPEEC